MTKVAQKLVLKPHGVGSTDEEFIVVAESPFRVGRRPENDAQISQPDISGTHAEFRYDPELEMWRVVDNRSTNGTFLNGKRIEAEASLNIGDIVHFATKGYQVVHDIDSMDESAFATKVLENSSEIRGIMDLVKIVKEQRTFPCYQPIVNLYTDEVVGWESLGRATSSDGPINPGSLFWLASQNKVEGKLSARFRESSTQCAICRHCWPAAKGSYLFFNLHPAEFHESDFLQTLDSIRESDLLLWYTVVMEMPESWVCNTQEMQVLVKEIRERGMLVAYDDFGRGQSRIPDLISCPPDFLKLDRQLVANLEGHQVKRDLVKAIVDACRELKVRTIGEGIETYEEMQACVDMGIELGQGFLLGKPKTAYELFQADIGSLPESCVFVRLEMVRRC